jgi:hypothetical protein
MVVCDACRRQLDIELVEITYTEAKPESPYPQRCVARRYLCDACRRKLAIVMWDLGRDG